MLITAVIMGMILGLSVLPAGASLTPMAWGMPIMAGGASLTTFGKDTAALTDNEAAAVAFPGSGGLAGGVTGLSLPTIAQTSALSQILSSEQFTNANQNYFFAYPYLSIGGAPIPSMGFF
jgi:hypothetical protein